MARTKKSSNEKETYHAPTSVKELLNDNESRLNALIGVIVVSVVLFLTTHLVLSFPSQLPEKQAVVAPTPTPLAFEKWTTYKNTTNAYTIKVNPTWKIDEKDPNRVIFNPTPKKGNNEVISQMILSIIANPQEGQSLTTQDEFDQWFGQSSSTTSKDKISKVATTTVNGLNILTLLNKENTSSKHWLLVNWFRSNDVNYYIMLRPSMELTPHNVGKMLELNKNIISSFNFYSPDEEQNQYGQ
jgi:hypothetical protein